LFAIYLALGVVAASCRDLQSLSRIHVGWLALFVVAGLTASSLGGLPEFPYPYAFEPIFAVSGTVAVVALALLSGIAKLDTPIQFLGRYSLEIYVVHTIASAAVRIALLKIAHVSAPAPHLVLGTLAGLYIPIALVLIFNRVGFRFGFTLPKSGTPTSRRSDIPIQPDQAQM
jgi:peptidoglycan/LPS O-acetylase OafA/YrhL